MLRMMRINSEASAYIAPKQSWFLPPVDDFKLDAFGLDDSFESSVGAVDVEFESLFKLWTVGVLHRARLVPLSLLLHTHINECIKRYKQGEICIICSLSQNDSYHTGKRELKLHTGIQIVR